MAKPTTQSWTKLSLWLGDGASPEDFTRAVCGMTTKEFTLSATTTDSEVPDCDDPDLPVWIERVVRALSGAFNGSGVMAEEIYPTYRDWMLSGQAKNARIVIDGTVPGYFAGRFVLTTLGTPGSLGDGKIGMAVAVQNDGEITWQNGAP